MSKDQKTNLFENITEYTIIEPYKYQTDMAKQIIQALKNYSKSASILTNEGISFKKFPSGDPDIKVDFDKVKDKDIIFILDLEHNETIFPQLSLINWLRCFVIPNTDQSLIDEDNGLKAWKATILENKYTLGQANSLTIVIPWYRHCQSERTSRFSFDARSNKYINDKDPHGAFLDIPTAQTFAALLSSQANLPPTTRDLITKKITENNIKLQDFPQRVLLIDIHDDLAEMLYPLGNPKPVMEHVLDNFNCWHNDPSKVYDMTTGNGKYFCSVLNDFLKSKQKKSPPLFDAVLFPDKGAFLRFKQIVLSKGINEDNIYYIVKKRVGGTIESDPDIYNSNGEKLDKKTNIQSSHILIIDDFTNSGRTLFKAREILDTYIENATLVSCWVSHFVGEYATDINTLIANIRINFTKFYCSNSLPEMTTKLQNANPKPLDKPIPIIMVDIDKKYEYTPNYVNTKLIPERQKIEDNLGNIEVFSCAPAIVDWIIDNPNPTTQGGSIKKYKNYKKYRKRTRKQKNHKK